MVSLTAPIHAYLFEQLHVDIPGPREGVYLPQFEGTLLTENGLYVLPLLLFPILLSSVTELAVHYLRGSTPGQSSWILGGLQMAFCLGLDSHLSGYSTSRRRQL